MAKQALHFDQLISIIEEATTNAQTKITELQGKDDNIGIADMFEMQILINQLTQLAEMSTSVVAASNSAIRTMAQNVNR